MNIEEEELFVILKTMSKRLLDDQQQWRLTSYTPLFYWRTKKFCYDCFQQSFEWEHQQGRRSFRIGYDESIILWKTNVSREIFCSLQYQSITGELIYGPIGMNISMEDKLGILPIVNSLIQTEVLRQADVLQEEFHFFYNPKTRKNSMDDMIIPDYPAARILSDMRDQNRADLIHQCVLDLHSNQPFGRFASAQIGMKECRQTGAFLIK